LIVKPEVVVLVCADAEWKALKETVQPSEIEPSPLGEWFNQGIIVNDTEVPLAFFQTGCGKIPAAAATQYVLDLWTPKLIINLGTCGGFEGMVKRGDVLLAHRTVVYDIFERSGGQEQQIEKYASDIDLSWLGEPPYPMGARTVTIASADQDLDPEKIVFLSREHGAVAADWESGAIAYVAWKKNRTKCLIVRGVSDIVGPSGNEIYEKPNAFAESVRQILPRLVEALPVWISKANL
jgi:adenosylhomocysteine nucleosidase